MQLFLAFIFQKEKKKNLQYVSEKAQALAKWITIMILYEKTIS